MDPTNGNFDGPWTRLVSGETKPQPRPIDWQQFFGYEAPTRSLGSFLASLGALPPSIWRQSYIQKVVERCDRRIDSLEERIDGVAAGRVMPDLGQVTIGSGKHFTLAVLFVDVCGFSTRMSWTLDQQKQVLRMMNIFMAEMLNVVRDYGGTFEKNTGDGIMAYFGEAESADTSRLKPAVEAAVTMQYINDYLLTPQLVKRGIDPVRFRVGIDLGPITIARIGLRGAENSIVAIGTTANVACKLMKLVPNGGICIGDLAYRNLPNNWGPECRRCEESTGFVWQQTQDPYVAWELNYRLAPPVV